MKIYLKTLLLLIIFIAPSDLSFSFALLDDTGNSIVRSGYWPTDSASDSETVIDIYLDSEGDLPNISDDDGIVEMCFDRWNDIDTASVVLEIAGHISRDEGASDPDIQFVYYDTDGSYTEEQGADSDSVLGFAFPFTVSGSTTGMYESSIIVINGKALRSYSSSQAEAQVLTTLTHEMGHFLGLDHSTYYDASSVPVMFPEAVSGTDQSTPKQDDIAAISSLYPNDSFHRNYGAIRGTISYRDGTGLFGANLIATNNAGDPVVSSMSGFPICFSEEYSSDAIGEYLIPGLPDGAYKVRLESFPADGASFLVEDEGALLNPYHEGSGVGFADFGKFDAGFPDVYFSSGSAGGVILSQASDVSVDAGIATTGVDLVIGQYSNGAVIGFFNDDESKIRFEVDCGSCTVQTTDWIFNNDGKFFGEINLDNISACLPPDETCSLTIYKDRSFGLSDKEVTSGRLLLFIINSDVSGTAKTYTFNETAYESADFGNHVDIGSQGIPTITGTHTKRSIGNWRDIGFDANCSRRTLEDCDGHPRYCEDADADAGSGRDSTSSDGTDGSDGIDANEDGGGGCVVSATNKKPFLVLILLLMPFFLFKLSLGLRKE